MARVIDLHGPIHQALNPTRGCALLERFSLAQMKLQPALSIARYLSAGRKTGGAAIESAPGRFQLRLLTKTSRKHSWPKRKVYVFYLYVNYYMF